MPLSSKDKKKLREYLDTMATKTLDPLTWLPKGQWHKVHNDGKSTTGGQFRSRSMLGTDNVHHVKVIDGGGNTVIENTVADPYGGAEVMAALDAAYNKLRNFES